MWDAHAGEQQLDMTGVFHSMDTNGRVWTRRGRGYSDSGHLR